MKKKQPTHGGARSGAGRPKQDEVKERHVIYIYPSIAAPIIEKYGSLQAALEQMKIRKPK